MAPLTLPAVAELIKLGWGTALVQDSHIGLTENLQNLMSQLLVGLINVTLSEDVERGSHQSKQCRVEIDCSVSTERHVHRYQPLNTNIISLSLVNTSSSLYLAGNPVGAKLAEPEGWRDLPQQSHHVNVLDETLRVRVVLGPEVDKLPQVVGTQDGPVPGEVVEVVHDDGDEQVENEEGADDEEADEERVGHVGAATLLLTSIVRLGVTDCSLAVE